MNKNKVEAVYQILKENITDKDGKLSLSKEELNALTDKIMEESKKLSLEDEFRLAVEEYKPQIERNIRLAKVHLAEAVRISNESGVPFVSNISEFVDRCYCPKLIDRWAILDKRKLSEISEAYPKDLPQIGWDYWNESSYYC